jgi:hypothetical protein
MQPVFRLQCLEICPYVQVSPSITGQAVFCVRLALRRPKLLPDGQITSPNQCQTIAVRCGGYRFFTVNLLDRRQTSLVDHSVDLREAVAATRQTRRFEIAAFVMDARNCGKILGEKRGLFGVTGRRYSIFP